MNKFLQTTLITAVLSTGAWAQTKINANISVENTLNIDGNKAFDRRTLLHGTLDFTPGGHGYIADGAKLDNMGTIKLGKPEGTPNEELISVNVTRDITRDNSMTPDSEDIEATTTTYYQYRYISTDGSVKYVWSQNKNATSSNTDFVVDMTDLTVTSAISDYASGFGLVKAIAGGTITGGQINVYSGNIDINTDAKYEVMTGYALNKDERTLTFDDETDPEKAFMEKYSDEQKKILGKDNSGGLFTPDITNPEVISIITADYDKNLGGESRNGLDPQKLSSQTEVKEYLSEWRVTMHKGTQDIAYEETESNTIIEQLARTTSNQAVAIPDELGKGNGEISIMMPGWENGESQKPDYVNSAARVDIKGNLHNIGYDDETLNFEKANSYPVSATIAFSGDNRYLKGTVNIGTYSVGFQGENSIPGGITNCYGSGIHAKILDPKTNALIDTAAAIVPENATLNILGEYGISNIEGNFVVKGVMNIGAPAVTE